MANYGELKTKVLSTAHRPELTAEVEQFVAFAQDVIARRLRAAEMLKRTTLTDSDRAVADTGIYTLPDNYLEERSYYLNGTRPTWLEKVSLAELRSLSASCEPMWFAILSSEQVEFRGVPSASHEIELIYFERPTALDDDADENTLLTNYESLYLDIALHRLYMWTQDIELALSYSDSADAAIIEINEQASRMTGGQRTRSHYDFSSYGGR